MPAIEVVPTAAVRLEWKSPRRTAVIVCLLAALSGCSWINPRDEGAIPGNFGASNVEHTRFVLGDNDSIMGQLATVAADEGDTLPDIARHFGLGFDEIEAANPGVDAWAPKPGERIVLPIQFTLPDAPRKGVVVNLAAMRMFIFGKGRGGGEVTTYPVGVGKEGRSTPTGDMFVVRKAANPIWHVPESIRRDHALKGDILPAAVLPGPDNPLGNYALYLSRASYLIHGTNKPYAIGLRASNGCLRLYPEDIEDVYKSIPLKTSVRVVNQPYLVGRKDGQVYLEAHRPYEELNAKRLKAEIWTKLKEIERRDGRKIDWDKADLTLREARGLPVPVFHNTDDIRQLVAAAIDLDPPTRLYGQPRAPEIREKAWYVKALDTGDELTAKRFAAMLNHQGPQIPATAIDNGDGHYAVLAGPFNDQKSGRKALKRLQVELEITGKLIGPETRIAARDKVLADANSESGTDASR